MADDRLCECGCGQVTPRSTRTRKERGQVKGEPLRYCYGHFRQKPGTQPVTPCNVDTFAVCIGPCGGKMHRGRTRACAEGHPPHQCRNLCEHCYGAAQADGTIEQYPLLSRSRGELLDAWVDLAVLGTQYWDMPARLDVTPSAWERAFQRARKANDPRAIRFDLGERAA